MRYAPGSRALNLTSYLAPEHQRYIVTVKTDSNLDYVFAQEELHTSVVCYCYCFLAAYLALAGLNLLAQISDRIHHFTALNSVHVRKLG